MVTSSLSSPRRADMCGRIEREIAAVLERRTRRTCVFMPSGRFAMHVAFRLLLSPGDRILMSPIEDDTVFFGALAAGLRPVMAPVSVLDGNIRVDAVPEHTWAGLAAVLTGNTYGLPDDISRLRGECERRGIPLIEDVAHAIETELDGRPVGSFGAAAVFSLSKHFPGKGGALALGPEADPEEAARLGAQLMVPRPVRSRVVGAARTATRGSLAVLRLRGRVDRAQEALRPVRPGPWRVALRPELLEHARTTGDLALFDPWMQTGYPDYRMRPRASQLRRTLASLRWLTRDREQRLAGVARLRTLDAAAPAVRDGPPLPLLRVPLLVEDRDVVALDLRRNRIKVYFVYDPPLDDYAGPELCERSPDPEAAGWWARHVLPVDPHDAQRLLDLVGRNQIRLQPATAPADARAP
jgi:DegT/DnrJ/EryC1/StrS aminotransferase family protein